MASKLHRNNPSRNENTRLQDKTERGRMIRIKKNPRFENELWALLGISGRSDEEEDNSNAFDWIFFGVYNWSDEEEDDSSGSESGSESDEE